MSDRNDTHGLFNSLKTIYGPRSNAVAPVWSADGLTIHNDMEEIKQPWKEHFENLLNQNGTADTNACNRLNQRHSRDELTIPEGKRNKTRQLMQRKVAEHQTRWHPSRHLQAWWNRVKRTPSYSL